MLRVLLTALVLALLTASQVGTASGTVETGSVVRLSALEFGIVKEINAVRARHGLQPLRVNQGLRAVSLAHSRRMVRDGFFEHDAPGWQFAERVRRYYTPNGFSRWTVGENIVYSTGDLSARHAVAMWMRSKPHRASILNPMFRELGVGAVSRIAAPGFFGGSHARVATVDFGFRAR